MLYGPNTNLGGNSIIYMLEGQIGYALAPCGRSIGEGLDWLDVRPEVQRAFNAWVDRPAARSVWESGCTSWYTTAAGRNTNNWPDHTFLYRYRVRHFDLAKLPGHAEAAGRRGMSASGCACRRRSRLGARPARPPRAQPGLPWAVQRRRLDRLWAPRRCPRGTHRRRADARRGARRGGDGRRAQRPSAPSCTSTAAATASAPPDRAGPGRRG